MKLPITVTLISRNEEARIEAAIRSVQGFASEIILVDSESTDQTANLARALGAKVSVRAFRGFGQQKNFAQSLASEAWVLNLDADERVSPELEKELRAFFTSENCQIFDAVFLPRKTWYLNRWVLHGGWYPNYLLRLARKSKAHWSEPALHESLEVAGKTLRFQQPLEHYSFPNQRSHILKNVEYAGQAKIKLQAQKRKATAFDFIFRPGWKFFDAYFIKLGFLDGAAGFFIAIHSAYATFLRYTYLYEDSVKNSDPR